MENATNLSHEDYLEGTDTTNELQSPEAEAGTDNEYTSLDEQGYTSLDEENDREVSSRGGMANFTQDVDAEQPGTETDDAEIREQDLPVQNLDDLQP